MRHIPYATSVLVILGGGWIIYMAVMASLAYLHFLGIVVFICIGALAIGMTTSKLRATFFLDKNGIAPVKRVAARKPRD